MPLQRMTTHGALSRSPRQQWRGQEAVFIHPKPRVPAWDWKLRVPADESEVGPGKYEQERWPRSPRPIRAAAAGNNNHEVILTAAFVVSALPVWRLMSLIDNLAHRRNGLCQTLIASIEQIYTQVHQDLSARGGGQIKELLKTEKSHPEGGHFINLNPPHGLQYLIAQVTFAP
eukprot:scaffold647880_cov47-Prasinocladus_malaysianus.AAC.2